MLSTSNISDINYYVNTQYYSLSKDQMLEEKQFAGLLINDLLINKKFNKEDFTNLCKGKITTANGEYIELGRKNKDGEIEHDMGRDLTFSAPKSVSLQHNMEGGDKRIKKALFTATKETLDYIERNYTFTRIKDESGKIKLMKTGNFSASLLYENLNRNLEFDDHIHCTIFNATKRSDGNIRSIEFKKIIENKMHFGMIFRMNLANQIQKLGYKIEVTDKKYNFFEIKNFDKNLCQEFSSRTEEINKKALELNKKPNSQTKQLANLLTRKDKSFSISNIKDAIAERLEKLYSKYSLSKEDIIENIESLAINAKNKKISSSNSTNAKKSIGFAIEHLSERKAYFSNQDIIQVASIYALSNELQINVTNLKKEIERTIKKKFLIKTNIVNYVVNSNSQEICLGTRDSLEREKSIISICYEGKNKFHPISPIKEIDHYFKTQEENAESKLTKGQLEAVKLILNCKDQFSIIQGYAGVGKTFAIGKAKEYLDHINQINSKENPNHIPYQIVGLAPSGSAAKELESVLGKADTLQYFVKKYNGYANGRGTIDGIEKEKITYKNKTILIDESSMIGSSQMHDLLNISKVLHLKLVFLGDKSQILSVDAGLPFYQLQKEDLKIAKMTDIVRQINPISKAIAYSSYAKDFQLVFEKVGSNLLDCSNHPKLLDLDYDKKNNKYFVTNDHTAKAAAILYNDLDKKEQENTLLITPSNSTRYLINQYVRGNQNLDKEKFNSINQTILTNENLTIVQKSNYYFFEKNHILLFNKASKRLNINKNEYFKVVKVNDNNRTLLLESLNNNSKSVIFDPQMANSLLENIEIYKKENREYCQNEKIIFTRKIEEANQYKGKKTTKEQTPKIINSTIATIANIDNDNNKISIKLDNNQIINIDLNDADQKHILSHSDYGYCLTNFKSQGKTQNNIIIVLESYFKYLADARNTLVAVTRAKNNIHIVTDNKEELIKQIVENYDSKKSDEISIINARYDNNKLLNEKITLQENLFRELNLSNESYNKYKLALINNQNFNKYYNQEKALEKTKELKSENIDPSLTKSDNFTGKTIAEILEPHKEIFIESKEKKKEKIKNLTIQKKLRQKASLTDIEEKNSKKRKSKSTNKLTYREKRQYILENLPDHEIKKHLSTEIINNFTHSDLSRMDNAIDEAFNNPSHFYRFGKNNSCSIIWNGKAGFIKDFRTDNNIKWGIGNIKLTDTEKALYGLKDGQLKGDEIKEIKSKIKTKEQYEAESIKRKEEQRIKQKIQYNNNAKKAERVFQYHKNQKINQDPKLREEKIKNHPYLIEKALNNNKKILNNKNDIVITKDGRLLISGKNQDNQIRTIQSIDAKGNKKLLKGAEKQGNFFLIKGVKGNEKTIYLTEGVATAFSINQATNCPTIACFDAGNIEKILKQLTTKFKDNNFIIAADNDRFRFNKDTKKIEEKPINTGKKKAIEAAKKYNAKVILPNFKNPENKDHIKLLSDFNDLHKHYGIDHVKQQLHNKENYLHLDGVSHHIKNIEIVK